MNRPSQCQEKQPLQKNRVSLSPNDLHRTLQQHCIAQPTGTHRGQVRVPRHPVPGTVGGRVTDARAVANLLRICPFADLTSTVGLHDDLNGRVNQCVMF